MTSMISNSPSGFNTSTLLLDQLQALQLDHDTRFHADIVALGTPKRMTHVALHLAKYLAVLSDDNKIPDYEKVFVDSFVMITSACNILGLRMSSNIINVENHNKKEYLQGYINSLSKLAKACEAADHIEDYPINKIWKESILSFLQLTLNQAHQSKIDLLLLAARRLTDVERNHGLQFILLQKT